MPEFTESDARKFVEVVNTRNVDKILEGYAEDATFQNPMLEAPVTGKAAIRDALAGGFAAFPDWHAEIKSVAVKGHEVFTTQTLSGTHQGPLPGPGGTTIPPTQRKFAIEGMVHLVVDEGGKIRSLRAYGDTRGLFRQLGIPP